MKRRTRVALVLLLWILPGCPREGQALGPKPVVLIEGTHVLSGPHRHHLLIADDGTAHLELRADASVEVLLFDRALTLDEETTVAASAATCRFAGQTIDGDCSFEAGSVGVLIRSDEEGVAYRLELSAVARGDGR